MPQRPLSGYRVIFDPFIAGQPLEPPVDVLTGFVDAEGRVRVRPVGVALDGHAGLLVANDVGNTVWPVSVAAP